MPRTPISLQQLLALLVIIGVAIWLIRRAGQELRDALARKEGAGPGLTPEQAEAIIGNGLATREELFLMPLKDQAFLATSALALQAAKQRKSQAVPPVEEPPRDGPGA